MFHVFLLSFIYVHTVWARSLQLYPAMDFVKLAAIGDEKGGFALNIAFNAAHLLTALALAKDIRIFFSWKNYYHPMSFLL